MRDDARRMCVIVGGVFIAIGAGIAYQSPATCFILIGIVLVGVLVANKKGII